MPDEWRLTLFVRFSDSRPPAPASLLNPVEPPEPTGSAAASRSVDTGMKGMTVMAIWRPDPSFYPSPRMAMKAPPEGLAFVAAFDPTRQRPDAISVVDVDPASSSFSQIVSTVEMPNIGDELHHFGWNACSSCLCPNAPHPHVERRYLVVPGLRSSRIHIIDTK